jgi:hypothetical protein
MRYLVKIVLSLALILCTSGLFAKTATQEAPQTARQALIEMFFSKQPGTLVKHLPAVTRATLEKSGALAGLQQYSMMASQVQAMGKTLQTFEAGSVILTSEDLKTGQKFEVVVDSDSLRGDQDDIAISLHSYKNNQEERTPFMPRFVFSMKTESGIWTLDDIAVTINLPLADPDFLKSFSEKMKANAAASSQVHIHAMGDNSAQASTTTFGGDASAIADLRKILAAETTYAATYPAVGFTCTLSDLDGFGSAETNEHQAMLISSGLASGKHLGYTFSLSGCSSSPAASYHLTAAPAGNSFGRKAFCTDQSGAIRSSADGNAASCQTSGTPVQ